MSLKLRLNTATATQVILAKIGNPQREEPLQTSRRVFDIAEADQEVLTPLFLKPFKNLIGHRFVHYTALDKQDMYRCAKTIFTDPGQLLPAGL